MRFDNPAWQAAPLRTGLRVAASLVRKRIGPLRTARVPYDGGRSSIHADLSTPLGLLLYRYGVRDTDIELTKRLLAPGDVFVDGGANIGLFTLAAAAQVGPTGKVIAFEPAREVRLRLTQNVALNRLVQVEVIPFALSSAPGEATFRTFDIAGAGLNHLGPSEGEAGTVESVKLTTLDAAVGPTDRRRLTLLKLDLEGAEHAALQGATEILRDVRPNLIIEIDESHLRRLGSSVAEVAALLRGHGYSFFQTRKTDSGEIGLLPLGDLLASKSGPNVFATTDVSPAHLKGVRIADRIAG
jgi:FkbM family methyltransferase